MRMFPENPVVPITHPDKTSYGSAKTSSVKLKTFLSEYPGSYLKDWHIHSLNRRERIYVTPEQFRGPSLDWLNLYCSEHPEGQGGFKFMYAGRKGTRSQKNITLRNLRGSTHTHCQVHSHPCITTCFVPSLGPQISWVSRNGYCSIRTNRNFFSIDINEM